MKNILAICEKDGFHPFRRRKDWTKYKDIYISEEGFNRDI